MVMVPISFTIKGCRPGDEDYIPPNQHKSKPRFEPTFDLFHCYVFGRDDDICYDVDLLFSVSVFNYKKGYPKEGKHKHYRYTIDDLLEFERDLEHDIGLDESNNDTTKYVVLLYKPDLDLEKNIVEIAKKYDIPYVIFEEIGMLEKNIQKQLNL